MAKTTLKALLKEDPVFVKKVKAITKMKMKDELWAEEIENLHVSRGIRALNTTALLQSSVHVGIESNIENQAVRSRCVEIKMRALKQILTFEETAKYLKKYIGAKYARQLKKSYGTITERKATIDYALNEIDNLVERLKFVVKIADVVIEDTDAAGYSLHRIGTLLEQKSKDR